MYTVLYTSVKLERCFGSKMGTFLTALGPDFWPKKMPKNPTKRLVFFSLVLSDETKKRPAKSFIQNTKKLRRHLVDVYSTVYIDQIWSKLFCILDEAFPHFFACCFSVFFQFFENIFSTFFQFFFCIFWWFFGDFFLLFFKRPSSRRRPFQ